MFEFKISHIDTQSTCFLLCSSLYLSLSFRRVVTFTWHFVLHLTPTFLRLFLVFIQHAENSIRRNLIFIRVLAGMLGERAPKGICARVLPSSVIHQRHIYVREFPFATQPFFLALCVCVISMKLSYGTI